METVQITVPKKFEEDVKRMVNEKIQYEISQLTELQSFLFENTVAQQPAVEIVQPAAEKVEEIKVPEEQTEARVIIKKERKIKRAKSPHPLRKGLLDKASEVLTNSEIPLTSAEIAFKLEKEYNIRSRKERSSICKSLSSILYQYTAGFDKRFDRAVNDKGSLIYTMRK